MSPEGSRTVDLNGSPAQDGGAIRQTIATVAGKRYRISVLALANGCCAPIGTAKTMRITTGASTSDHTLTTLWGSESTTSPECDWTQWTRIEREWIADSGSTIIEFRSLVLGNAGGILIDDLSVTEVEPRDLLVPSQYATLDVAIAASQPNDRVLVAPGTYPWTPANITHSLTIQGIDGAMSTRFVGTDAETAPLVVCAPGAGGRVTLRNLLIANGQGVLATDGTLEVERCMFAWNTNGLTIEATSNFGGATLRNCAFVSNGGPSTGHGGGMAVYAAATNGAGANIIDSMFLDNQAQEGGGVHVTHSASSATNCIFARNHATEYSGGAITRWWGHVAIPVSNCSFTGNTAEWGGTENWNCCVACSACNFSPTIDTTTDCNQNGIPDAAEMRVDVSVDADQNGDLDACQPDACPGDLNHSGVVDGVDLDLILSEFGSSNPKYPASDINGDGIVNGFDLAIVLSSWGACP